MQEIRAVISLSTIVRNAVLVKKRAGVPLIAVIKDDAYGHGAEAVAHALEKEAAMFAVSTVREGAALRAAGVGKEVLVFTPPLCAEEALSCALHRLIPTISSFPSLRLCAEAAQKYGFEGRVQLAVNTGMNRYGFSPAQTERACREAERAGIAVLGVYSHFFCPENGRARERQYEYFVRASETVKKYFPCAVRHLSATGGILAGSKYRFDAVRSGIALYGYLPAGFAGGLPVRPAMKLYAAVAQSGRSFGEGVGYRLAEREYGALHTLRLGYGDGFFRTGGLGEGDLCMDACVCEGRAVFGTPKRILRDMEKYARDHGTSVYEVLVSVGRRAEKFYV